MTCSPVLFIFIKMRRKADAEFSQKAGGVGFGRAFFVLAHYIDLNFKGFSGILIRESEIRGNRNSDWSVLSREGGVLHVAASSAPVLRGYRPES